MNYLLLIIILIVGKTAGETTNKVLTNKDLIDDESMNLDELPIQIKLKTNCNACHLRDELKTVSLETIKAHVLNKLGFYDQIPIMNRTSLPKIPQEIYENYYNKSGYTNRSPYDYEMLSDEPMFQPGAFVDEEDDDYFPITDSIYAFPTPTKIRHNRKVSEILKFRLNNLEYTMVSRAILYIYVHGQNWIKLNEPTLDQTRNFTLSVNRVVLRNPNQPENILLRQEYEQKLKIPSGNDEIIKIDVTKMISDWFQSPQNNHGMIIKLDQLGKKLITLTGNDHGAYIEIKTKDTRKRRTKRSMSLDCRESDNEKRCCRYPLSVDFETFGWDWVIAPKRYEANYCAGECAMSFLPRYTHTHIWQLSTSAQPCCSPRKMSPLKLLYFDKNYNIVYSVLPNMIVEKCSCS